MNNIIKSGQVFNGQKTDVPLQFLCLQDILESEQTYTNLFDLYKWQEMGHLQTYPAPLVLIAANKTAVPPANIKKDLQQSLKVFR